MPDVAALAATIRDQHTDTGDREQAWLETLTAATRAAASDTGQDPAVIAGAVRYLVSLG